MSTGAGITILQWCPTPKTRPRPDTSLLDFHMDPTYAVASANFMDELERRTLLPSEKDFVLVHGLRTSEHTWTQALDHETVRWLHKAVLACIKDASRENLNKCFLLVMQAFCFESNDDFTFQMLHNVAHTARARGETEGSEEALATETWLRTERAPILRALGVRLRACRLYVAAQYRHFTYETCDPKVRDFVNQLARVADNKARRKYRLEVKKASDKKIVAYMEECAAQSSEKRIVRYERDESGVLEACVVVDRQSREELFSVDRAELLRRLHKHLEGAYVCGLRDHIKKDEHLKIEFDSNGLVMKSYYENVKTKEQVHDLARPTAEDEELQCYTTRCKWVIAARDRAQEACEREIVKTEPGVVAEKIDDGDKPAAAAAAAAESSSAEAAKVEGRGDKLSDSSTEAAEVEGRGDKSSDSSTEAAEVEGRGAKRART